MAKPSDDPGLSVTQPELPLSVGIVVIGRNEGERLKACLASLPAGLPAVYVDSGSTDGSPEHARSVGAQVVELDMSRPFSAGRARNEGAEELLALSPDLDAIQFLDGDTVLDPSWLEAATAFLAEEPSLGVVAGRRRERWPEASFYNALCDDEWNTPVGQTAAVGGDALYRVEAFRGAGGFDPSFVCGEEPELCRRMGKKGYGAYRMDQEMTLHDAAIHDFTAWWKRAVRSGYAWMLGALRHGRDGYNVKESARALFWGGVMPALFVLGLFAAPPVAIVTAGLYLFKLLKLRRSFGGAERPWKRALFIMLTNQAEIVGMARCLWESAAGQRRIVEYKS